MALPYTTLSNREEVVIAGLPIKKLGCLTVAEMQAAVEADAQTKEQLKEMSPLLADIFLKQHIATILLKSRLDRAWTLEQTMAPEWDVVIDGEPQKIEPDMMMLNDLFTFFMNEQKRWVETPATAEESTGKKQTGRKSTGS